MIPDLTPDGLAPELPEAHMPLTLGLKDKTLRGLSRCAHVLAERMLVSPLVDAPKIWAQTRQDPKRFANKTRLSGLHTLEARWSAAIMAAREGRLEPVMETLRSNAWFCPPNDNHHFVDESRHMATPRADLARIAGRPDASQELLSAIANANIPTHIANGVISMAFDAFVRLEKPLEAIRSPNAKVNFARGLNLLAQHSFEESMLCIARAPNLPDLARCGLLDYHVWREASPFSFYEQQDSGQRPNGAVGFVMAVFNSKNPSLLGERDALNTAMMLRFFLSRSHLSETWLAETISESARRHPDNEAFLGRGARMTFPSPPAALLGQSVFIQAFESRDLARSLPEGKQARPSLGRSL